jgi:hypothetical protein
MNQSEKDLAKTALKPNITRIMSEDTKGLIERQMTRLITNANMADIQFDDIITILEEITKLKNGTLELKFQNYQLTKINGYWKSYPRKTK